MKKKRIGSRQVTKTAVIKALEGRIAVAVTTREDACEHCSARDTCHAVGGTGANATVRAINTVDAQVGDTVTIAMASTTLLKASFLIYMVPVLALIGGILIGFLVNSLVGINESVAVGISSGLCLVAAFVWLRKKGKDLGQRTEYIPQIVEKKAPSEILSPGSSSCSVRS
jgi:sigma-E factor negative regulatory protein RseC